MRHVNRATLDLIKSFESCSLKAYKCQAGVWTIGWGHTGGVKEGDTITQAQADQLLENDLSVSEQDVERIIQIPLNDNQFGALVSFDFNCGGNALAQSTLHHLLEEGKYSTVPGQLGQWNKAKDPKTGLKRVVPGLVRRRQAEIDLWNTPVDTQN